MKRSTRSWVIKAEHDFCAAQNLSDSPDALHDAVCFHCQQCAEKYLKGLLVEHGIHFPKTHNLLTILHLLLPQYPTLRTFRRGLRYLGKFAVEGRYPMVVVTKRQAASALIWSQRVRIECRQLLQLTVD